ncbi:hypothetical protein [Sinorhizobium meliloti]|uniref:hypothetical protein n=1 Tax=Rhizobium meliloti TaxID=382 RepID=UPI00299E18FD
MAPRRRRRRDGSPWAILGIVGLLGFVFLSVSGYAMLKIRANEAVVLDANQCPETGPVSVRAILLDLTDPISEITQVDLKRQFERTVSEIEVGGLIEVYALTSDEGKLTPTFRGCNPGDGATADPWTSNPRKKQQRWEEAFNKPLRELADSIGNGSESKRSPIMAGVQRIVIERFSTAKLEGISKRLYVASDMMENTDAFSIYESGANYDAFVKSAGRDKFRAPLDGTDVKFWAFQRETSSDQVSLANFWATWVEANGGSFVGYERLAGVE